MINQPQSTQRAQSGVNKVPFSILNVLRGSFFSGLYQPRSTVITPGDTVSGSVTPLRVLCVLCGSFFSISALSG